MRGQVSPEFRAREMLMQFVPRDFVMFQNFKRQIEVYCTARDDSYVQSRPMPHTTLYLQGPPNHHFRQKNKYFLARLWSKIPLGVHQNAISSEKSNFYSRSPHTPLIPLMDPPMRPPKFQLQIYATATRPATLG